MPADELNRPLGLGSPTRQPRRKAALLSAAGVAAVVILAGGAVAWYALPFGGPTATAVIDGPRPEIDPARTGAILPPGGLTEVAPSGGLSDMGNGGGVVIHGLPNAPMQLASLPETGLVEDSDDGPLPRIAADGTRPLDAYARPNSADPRDTRVAIVIGGIGIDDAGTANAIQRLPGQVTLAFAPYGDDLSGALAAARQSGHEILLQVPLEPFNYPKTDPGPNTLTLNADGAENISRLHWFMGRLTNYVGVVNYMGARFTSEVDAVEPVIQEIGNRGLLYLDDGSSARSRTAEAAAGVTPYLRADLVLDADLSGPAIDAKLRQLQAIARQRGYAIATGTAFPETIDRVTEFVDAAASAGISIVPLSALTAGPS